MNMNIPVSKLRPLTYDARDKSLHRNFGSITSFPETLNRPVRAVKDQGESDFCTAYCTSVCSEYQESIEFSPEYQAAKEGEVNGSPILNGTDPRSAMKTATIFGSLPEDKAPYTLQTNGANFVSKYENWDSSLDNFAFPYRKGAYLSTDGPQDKFDNIRSALQTGFDKNQVVMAFGRWYDTWNDTNGIIPEVQGKLVSYHAYLFIDFVTINGIQYLKAQLSNGVLFGDGGFFYFSRGVINREFGYSDCGTYIFKDLGDSSIDDLLAVRFNLISFAIELARRLLLKLAS